MDYPGTMRFILMVYISSKRDTQFFFFEIITKNTKTYIKQYILKYVKKGDIL